MVMDGTSQNLSSVDWDSRFDICLDDAKSNTTDGSGVEAKIMRAIWMATTSKRSSTTGFESIQRE
jgi:hypothetical protein